MADLVFISPEEKAFILVTHAMYASISREFGNKTLHTF